MQSVLKAFAIVLGVVAIDRQPNPPMHLHHDLRRHLRTTAIALGAAATAIALAGMVAAQVLSNPAQHAIGPMPTDMPITLVRLEVPAGDHDKNPSPQHVSGWLVPGVQGQGAVLLLHGVRSDRRQMLERARWLHRHGYTALLIDLPAHGESSGERITFGHRESAGVRAALDYLHRQRPTERIAVIGVSLGAASFMLANASPAPAAVVLESMFPTITEAVTNRLTRQLGPAGPALAPALLWQLPWRTGVSADDLRPIEHMPTLRSPVLVISGTLDAHTTLQESQRIFTAAPAPKQWWPVAGAGHVDLHQYNRAAYEARVLAFLERYVGQP